MDLSAIQSAICATCCTLHARKKWCSSTAVQTLRDGPGLRPREASEVRRVSPPFFHGPFRNHHPPSRGLFPFHHFRIFIEPSLFHFTLSKFLMPEKHKHIYD